MSIVNRFRNLLNKVKVSDNQQDVANKFKEALNQSRVNLIDALNNNQKQLYDIFFKVIGVPNIIIILAVSNKELRELVHSHFYLKCFYLSIIYSYLVALLLYISDFFVSNYAFNKKIKKIDKYSRNVQKAINVESELELDFQYKMNESIEDTHHLHKAAQVIAKSIKVIYLINVISFIIFIVILINNML